MKEKKNIWNDWFHRKDAPPSIWIEITALDQNADEEVTSNLLP